MYHSDPVYNAFIAEQKSHVDRAQKEMNRINAQVAKADAASAAKSAAATPAYVAPVFTPTPSAVTTPSHYSPPHNNVLNRPHVRTRTSRGQKNTSGNAFTRFLKKTAIIGTLGFSAVTAGPGFLDGVFAGKTPTQRHAPEDLGDTVGYVAGRATFNTVYYGGVAVLYVGAAVITVGSAIISEVGDAIAGNSNKNNASNTARQQTPAIAIATPTANFNAKSNVVVNNNVQKGTNPLSKIPTAITISISDAPTSIAVSRNASNEFFPARGNSLDAATSKSRSLCENSSSPCAEQTLSFAKDFEACIFYGYTKGDASSAKVSNKDLFKDMISHCPTDSQNCVYQSATCTYNPFK